LSRWFATTSESNDPPANPGGFSFEGKAMVAKKSKKSSRKKSTAAQRVKLSARSVREIAPFLKNERKKITSEAMRASLANEALTLQPHEPNKLLAIAGLRPFNFSDVPIRKAFAEFGLDPEVPRHWRMLLGYLAEAHFAESPTENRYLKIRVEFENLLKTGERKNAVIDLAKRHSMSVRAIWALLKRSKDVFGY
jgi:hypothetical protein